MLCVHVCIYFNPLGRKTETLSVSFASFFWRISIHSVARPRPCTELSRYGVAYFNPLGRKTETAFRFLDAPISLFQSTRSQDRDNDIAVSESWESISIHSVARPRLLITTVIVRTILFQSTRSQDRDLEPNR